MVFILCCISRGLEFLSINHTSVYKNFESKVFKNKKFVGEISSNWPNDFLEIDVYKILESRWELSLTILQCTY